MVDNVLGDLTSAATAAWIAQGNSGAIVLNPGQGFTFTFTTPTVQNAGAVTNTVTVTGQDDENTLATAQDSHTLTVTGATPTITVDKAAATINEGNTATYTFTIENTSVASTDPVTITSVVDNVLGNLTSAANDAWLAQGNTGAIILSPGEIFTFSFTTGVLDAGTVANTITVSGLDDDSTPVSAG